MNMTDKDCTICYRIACKKCDWVASDEEVEKIQKGLLTVCPICGWKPGETVNKRFK